MRVAYVTMAFPASSETFASNDVRYLRAHGVAMTVHSLRKERPEASVLRAERALDDVVVTYPNGLATLLSGFRTAVRRPRAGWSLLKAIVGSCVHTPKHLVRSLYLWPRVLEIFDALADDPPDVVHAYWAHYPTMVLHLVQDFLPGVTTSVSFSAYDIRHRYPVTRQVARRSDVVRSLSTVTARETADAFDLPLERIAVVYDSIDLTSLPDDTARVPRRIVTAGRLVRAKGMEEVLRTFALIRHRVQDATLRVLGSGPDLDRLRGVAADLGVEQAVAFVGHVAQAQVLEEMHEAEVFLFLSWDERLPNVVKEAMVSGCICVVSHTTGIDELVEDGATGFVVEQRGIEQAAERVLAVLEGRVEAEPVRSAAVAHIRERFALDANARQYLVLWRGPTAAPLQVGDGSAVPLRASAATRPPA
ncbi:MAG: glycosyltransferase family 4 protein, partial [Trueperaceae bacterium]|nr:glycosyltransferase family 4 protein [Trueperaceae bacterium]